MTGKQMNLLLLMCVPVSIGFFYAALYFGKSYSCTARWQGTYEAEFGMLSGCRVKVDGKFLPEANVRAVQ
jgi:hypothetical protein